MKCDEKRARYIQDTQAGVSDAWEMHRRSSGRHHSYYDEDDYDRKRSSHAAHMRSLYQFEDFIRPTNLLLIVLPTFLLIWFVTNSQDNNAVISASKEKVYAWFNPRSATLFELQDFVLNYPLFLLGPRGGSPLRLGMSSTGL